MQSEELPTFHEIRSHRKASETKQNVKCGKLEVVGLFIGEFYFHLTFSKFSIINVGYLYRQKSKFTRKIDGSIQGTELVLS